MKNKIIKIKFHLQKSLKNTFVKSIVQISSGTAFAQFVTIILSPIITRIYSPEEFGVLTLFNSILIIIALVGSLKYELTIPIVEDEEQAINSLSLSFIVLMFFVTSSTLILIFEADSILRRVSAEVLVEYWYLIPIGILVAQTYRILTQYAYRQKNFKGIAQTTMIQSLSSNLLKIGTGLLGFSVIGLLSSKVIGESIGTPILSNPLLKNKALFRKITRKKMKWIAKRYVKFPLYQFPSTLVGQCSIHLPVFFLGFIFNNQVVGAFGLANTIVRLPMSFIGKSVGNVFFAEAANIGQTDPKRLIDLSNKLFKKLIIIGLFPLGILLFFAPFLFTFIFGESWTEAGNFARILSVLVFSEFIFTPISRVFEVFEKQAQILVLNIGRIVFIGIAFGIAIIYEMSQYTTIIIYTIGMSFIFFVTYLLAQKYMIDKKKAIYN